MVLGEAHEQPLYTRSPVPGPASRPGPASGLRSLLPAHGPCSGGQQGSGHSNPTNLCTQTGKTQRADVPLLTCDCTRSERDFPRVLGGLGASHRLWERAKESERLSGGPLAGPSGLFTTATLETTAMSLRRDRAAGHAVLSTRAQGQAGRRKVTCQGTQGTTSGDHGQEGAPRTLQRGPGPAPEPHQQRRHSHVHQAAVYLLHEAQRTLREPQCRNPQKTRHLPGSAGRVPVAPRVRSARS